MDENKISVNIEGNTFEATGPDANEQFKVFVSLLREGVVPAKTAKTGAGNGAPDKPSDGSKTLEKDDLQKVFEASGEHLHLKYPPVVDGDDKKERVKAAILMILYGFKEVLGVNEVGVIKLSKALEESGLGKYPRLTFATDPLYDEGLILKSGNRVGAKFRTTPSGSRKATDLVGRLIGQIG